MTISTMPSPPTVEDPDNFSVKMENWMAGFNNLISSTNSTASSVYTDVSKVSTIYKKMYNGGVIPKVQFFVDETLPKVYLNVTSDNSATIGGSIISFNGLSIPSNIKPDTTVKLTTYNNSNSTTGRAAIGKVISTDSNTLSVQILCSYGSPETWELFTTKFLVEPCVLPTSFRFLNINPSDTRILEEILGTKKNNPLKNYYGVSAISNNALHCCNVNRKWVRFTGTAESF